MTRRLALLAALATLTAAGCGSKPEATARELLSPDEWVFRVGVICDWELEQSKALRKALGAQQSYGGVRLLLDEVLRLSEQGTAMFSRLETPPELREQRARLLRLFRRERALVKKIIAAFHDGREAAFVRSARALEVNGQHIREQFAELGADGCLPDPTREKREGDEVVV